MSGFSRVSISDSLWKTIRDIKEIAGQHSDEDIYAMLKECSMDPNETAQKLLYLDTFHEVKRKRDQRKMRRGPRGGNHYSSYTSAVLSDAIGGRQVNARQENGYSSPMGRASKYTMRAPHKESDKTPAPTGFTASTNGSASVLNGSSINELTSQLAECNNKHIVKGAKADYDHKTKSPSLQPLNVKQFPNLDPGATPTSTPTNTSKIATRARIPGGSLMSKSSHLGNSVGSPSGSGLYSSKTDPVLVPTLNPQNPGSVGIIKHETGNQQNSAEISADQNVTIDQAVSAVDLIINTQPKDYHGVERSQADSSILPSSTGHLIAADKGNQETCSVQQVNPSSKVEDPSPEEAASEVDAKLHKLDISAKQSVIFPHHLHIPKASKNTLTFGSLEVSLGQSNEGTSPKDASVPTNIEVSKEPSVIPQSSPQMNGCSNFPDCPPSPPYVLVNLKSSQENVSSGTALRYNQSKQELLHTVGGSHNSIVTPLPDYGLSLIPPAVGSHLLERLEPQGGSSMFPSAGATPSMTQPRGIPQNSISVSPHMIPFLRQTYPPNYIPYNPYFPEVYVTPQNAHQLLSHNGFPHQPSTGNIYMPPTAAASEVKFPIPPVYKPGNLTHFAASGYASYGGLPPRTCSNDDIPGCELKETNVYPTIKQCQNEDLHVMNSASALRTNVYYIIPQEQHVGFQAAHNAFPGLYHPTQNMSPASLVQSQPTLESTVPPLSCYSSQPQPQLLPLPQQQYGHMNWNPKLLNRENV